MLTPHQKTQIQENTSLQAQKLEVPVTSELQTDNQESYSEQQLVAINQFQLSRAFKLKRLIFDELYEQTMTQYRMNLLIAFRHCEEITSIKVFKGLMSYAHTSSLFRVSLSKMYCNYLLRKYLTIVNQYAAQRCRKREEKALNWKKQYSVTLFLKLLQKMKKKKPKSIHKNENTVHGYEQRVVKECVHVIKSYEPISEAYHQKPRTTTNFHSRNLLDQSRRTIGSSFNQTEAGFKRKYRPVVDIPKLPVFKEKEEPIPYQGDPEAQRRDCSIGEFTQQLTPKDSQENLPKELIKQEVQIQSQQALEVQSSSAPKQEMLAWVTYLKLAELRILTEDYFPKSQEYQEHLRTTRQFLQQIRQL